MDAREPLPLHLRQLAYLREVARQGGVTRAAEALGVSQPALSQGLAELERRIGVALLERAGRGRRLTAAGREVLAFAESTLAAAAELQARLRAEAKGAAGTLRVGMIDAASLYLLPGVIRAYRARHPEVALQVQVATSGELLAGLRVFELDLAFAVGPADDDLEAAEVAREGLLLCGPPRRGRGRVQVPADADWVLYPARSRTRAIIDAALARAGVQPRVVLESANPDVLRQLVSLGLGWSVLPEAVARSGPEPLAAGERLAERSILGLRRRGGAADARAAAFLDAARAAGSGLR